MNQLDALKVAQDATAEVPAGARERVWRRLGARPAPPRLWVRGLAFAACAAAGFALVSSLTASPEPTVFTTEGSVATSTGGLTRSADGALHLGNGLALVSTFSGPGVTVVAGGHHIEAEVAVFSVDVAGQSVTVDVREGSVRVDGERVDAVRRWPPNAAGKTADFAALAKLEPVRAGEDRTWALAERASREGDYPQALQRYEALGGGGLRAEAALLKKGELQLRQLKSPSNALSTFDEAVRRFPEGSLTQELTLSSLEASLALERWADARTRAAAFLARFPDSERLLDVRYVAALAAWQLKDKLTTCSEIRGLQTSALQGERRATLEKLAAQCTLFER